MKRGVLAFLLVFGFVLSSFVGPSTWAQNRPYPPPSDPWAYNNGPGQWDQSWNNRPFPRRGACFFRDANYSGNHFCVRAGDRLPSLPGNFGNSISSIQVFGGAKVQIFNDSNFSNGNQLVNRNVRNLKDYRFRGGHTWNDRISSLIVM